MIVAGGQDTVVVFGPGVGAGRGGGGGGGLAGGHVVVVVVWAAVHSRQLHALRHQLLRTGQRARLFSHL